MTQIEYLDLGGNRFAEITKTITFTSATDAPIGDDDSIVLPVQIGKISRLRIRGGSASKFKAGQQVSGTALVNDVTNGVTPTTIRLIHDGESPDPAFAADDYIKVDNEIMLVDLAESVAAGQVWSFNENTDVYTDETTDFNDDGANDVAAVPIQDTILGDILYIGHATKKFSNVYLDIGTAGDYVATIVWEYWNGSAWGALSPTDGTDTGSGPFYQDGTVAFDPPSNWAKETVNAVEAYYIRARVSAVTSVTVAPLITQGWLNYGTLTVTRACKDTLAEYHDNNTVITKCNSGLRIALYPNSSYNEEEKFFEWTDVMIAEFVTDAAITANDEYLGLTTDPSLVTDLGIGDLILIDDTVDEIAMVQSVFGDMVNATYDNNISVQAPLVAHTITKDVERLLQYDIPIPFKMDSPNVLYIRTNIDEKISEDITLTITLLVDV